MASSTSQNAENGEFRILWNSGSDRLRGQVGAKLGQVEAKLAKLRWILTVLMAPSWGQVGATLS
eukprot:11175241-Karenia_brevis.AAC.1